MTEHFPETAASITRNVLQAMEGLVELGHDDDPFLVIPKPYVTVWSGHLHRVLALLETAPVPKADAWLQGYVAGTFATAVVAGLLYVVHGWLR